MKSAFGPGWLRGNKILNLLRKFKGNMERKSLMKRNVYMEFQVVCVHIQIFVQGLLLIKILLMEFSLHNIFQFS